MNTDFIFLKINTLPLMVWDAETPHGLCYGRGHLRGAFFINFLNITQWKRKIPESGTACALQT